MGNDLKSVARSSVDNKSVRSRLNVWYSDDSLCCSRIAFSIRGSYAMHLNLLENSFMVINVEWGACIKSMYF